MTLEKIKQIFSDKNEVYLRVKANPGSAKSAIRRIMADETLKIDVAAPAEKGKANQELVKFLAREFDVSKDNVKIISGAGERLKMVKISR